MLTRHFDAIQNRDQRNYGGHLEAKSPVSKGLTNLQTRFIQRPLLREPFVAQSRVLQPPRHYLRQNQLL